MVHHNKPRKPRKPSTVTVIENKLLDSQAWKTLNASAINLYIIFLRMRCMEDFGKKGQHDWVCTNGRELILPYKTAQQKYGITERRFTLAIDMLIGVGLLDIVIHGGGTIGKVTIYGLSNRWEKYGTDSFEHHERIKSKVGKCIYCGINRIPTSL